MACASTARRHRRAERRVAVRWLVDMAAERRAADDSQADQQQLGNTVVRLVGLTVGEASHTQGQVDQPPHHDRLTRHPRQAAGSITLRRSWTVRWRGRARRADGREPR
jgi:hypothetical protein